MSEAAKKRYIISSTKRVNDKKLKIDSDQLPARYRNWKEFKESFGNKNNYDHVFMGYKIYVNVRYAFGHFQKNTYNENRASINATILPTLNDPLLVVKEKYEGKDALTFYKPFVSEDKLLHILMYKAIISDDGIYKFKTIYEAHTISKVSKIINLLDLNTLYFKYDKTEGSGN